MNYQPAVKNLLRGEAEIYAPGENCRFAKYTYFNLIEWLPCYPSPDVIHWNNGLWDCILRYDGKPFTAINEYLRDMELIATYLSKTGAKIIFATSTPVKPERKDWDNSIIKDYNKAVLNVIKGKGFIVNDLHSTVENNITEMIGEDGCHLSQFGIKICGKQTADIIRAQF